MDRIFPDDLGEVTGGRGESRVAEVVVIDLIVPEVDVVRGVGVSSVCQVLTVVWRPRVLSGALGGVVRGVVGKSLIPCHGRDAVEGSVLVVPVDHSVSEVSGDAGGCGRGGRFGGRWAGGWRFGRRRSGRSGR